MRLPGKAPAGDAFRKEQQDPPALHALVTAAEHEVALRALHDAFAAA